MLSQELHNKAKAMPTPGWPEISSSESNVAVDLLHEESLSVPSRAESEPVPLKTAGVELVPPSVAAKSSGKELVPSSAAELETEKHPVQSTEMQIIDKAVVEEEPVNQTKHQHSSSSSSARVLDEKFEDDNDDWLKDDSSEVVGASRTLMPLGNEEDVSFSDLEEDDGDMPASYKKVTSGSDTSTKDSRDWVQLSGSSADSVKGINPASVKHAGSEQVSARNSESKESNDWLDVEDIEVM